MKIKITYPPVEKKKITLLKIKNVAKWPLLTAAIVCPALNAVIGGKAWSIIVLMALYMVWTLTLSPDMVEYNRISQLVKLICLSNIMLALIDIFLVSGWAVEVVGIVQYCGLITAGILFFTDLEKQKQNMFPLLFLIFFSLISSVIGLTFYKEEGRWALEVMGAIALVLLIACIAVLNSYLIRELKKRFHTK